MSRRPGRRAYRLAVAVAFLTTITAFAVAVRVDPEYIVIPLSILAVAALAIGTLAALFAPARRR